MTAPTARQIGAAGGRARAEKLPPARRREIARQAAEARWAQERRNYWRHWPKLRISLADFEALPIGRQQHDWRAWYRMVDERCGRWCVVEPVDDGLIGIKLCPVIRVRVESRALP